MILASVTDAPTQPDLTYTKYKGPKLDRSRPYVAKFDPISEIKVSRTFFSSKVS